MYSHLRNSQHRARFWDKRVPAVRGYWPEPYTVGRLASRKCARCHRVQFWDGLVPTVRSRRHRVRFWDGTIPTVYSHQHRCCHRVQLWDGWVPTVRSRRHRVRFWDGTIPTVYSRDHAWPSAPPPCTVLGRMGPYRAQLSAGTVHGREGLVPEVRTVPPCTVLGRTGPHRAQSLPRARAPCTVLGRTGPYRVQSLPRARRRAPPAARPTRDPPPQQQRGPAHTAGTRARPRAGRHVARRRHWSRRCAGHPPARGSLRSQQTP